MTRRTLPSAFSEGLHPSPFFRSLQDEIDRVFDRFTGRAPEGEAGELPGLGTGIMPALDVAETDDAIEVTAEMPGVAEADLDVSISAGVLTIKGEKSADRDETRKDYRLVERRYGRFRRSLNLGFDPGDDGVEATFADGVLRLRIAKPQEAVTQTRKIEIAKS